MSRPDKARPSQPARMTAPQPPVEVIELTGNRPRVPAPPVTLTPADQVDIIELHPQPRVELVVVVRVEDRGAAAVALAAARFASALHAADRKLRLKIADAGSRAGNGEVTLVLSPGVLGSEGRERLARLAGAVRGMTGFDGITPVRAEVVPAEGGSVKGSGPADAGPG